MNPHHRHTPSGKLRARGAGVPLTGTPGQWNAITDVPGVEVGYTTLIKGEGPLVIGEGPVRTGVTAILPRGRAGATDGVFSGAFSLNGNGEATGLHWIEETGRLDGPITISNTHAVGTLHSAVIKWLNGRKDSEKLDGNTFWMPVAAETCDNWLNDMNGFHVREEHVHEAIDSARSGPVEEGSCGGGTGMSCYQFKGGSGTASRKVRVAGRTYTVGAFVQTNFGVRKLCTIGGVPIGRYIPYSGGQIHRYLMDHPTDQGSIIIVVATDAPLSPLQLKRLARRAGIGMARSGGIASNESGDIFIAFSTANLDAYRRVYEVGPMESYGEFMMTPMMEATVESVDEAILNALFTGGDMTGRDGNVRDGLPVDKVIGYLKHHNMWVDPEA
jgi:L-aminopeptidase/D-esterase-like protein